MNVQSENGENSKSRFPRDMEDTIRIYFHDMGDYRPLSAKKEREWAREIAEAREELEQILTRRSSESEAEHERLISEAQKKLADKIRRLVKANLRLVVSIAKKYVNRGLAFSDLLQEGNIGLIKAAERFDWRRGCRFSTYATWWIRQSISRGISDKSRTIRLPVHLSDRLSKIRNVSNKIYQEEQRYPTYDEIAEVIGRPVSEVEMIFIMNNTPVSLQSQISEDENSTLCEIIPDESAESPEKEYEMSELRMLVQAALTPLTERERSVLRLRFGIGSGVQHTLEEIGRFLGLTRERIRQIEKSALNKLRKPGMSKDLDTFL